MKQLEKVQNNTTWAKASNAINNNNDALYVAVTTLEHAAFKNKGYFKSVALLYGAYPTAENGAQAFVYNSSNPTSAPYDIYEWVNDAWQDTGVNGGNVNVNLDSKQDTLVGYSESVSGGKATQVAIQGDTIALSGKVSLGNVDNMESAILMSSSQAGAAIAKANTLEQSMNAIKSPIKPIQLNSQGKLELNIGKGLYVEDGKLCTTGASGGGGGGTTYSEGQGISIYNDQISVAYNVETLTIDDCGGLSVNYGEGLTIKNGKLSAQASVNAGNGLVKKGDALQVSVGPGLVVEDDVYVNIGKGLATDNENKVNVNLDEQTLTTDSSGKIIVNKDSLIGNGLKQEFSKLAVNYGTGLALSNKAIVVNYGTGLSIQDGKLVSTVQGGKTYVGGQAVNITGNEINVKYDGVTISTKDSSDNSLHVMLGSGLIQGTSGIDVAVGSGLAIGSDNKLYSTVSSGKTYTAGDGIDINGNKIAVLYGSGLTTNTCGKLIVDAANLTVGYADYASYAESADHAAVSCSASYASSAGKATADANGNNIADTYLKSVGASGDGISISGGKIAVKYCDGLQITNGHLAIATGDGLHCNNGGKLAINPSFGLGFTTDGMLKLKLHDKSGLQATSAGLGVNAGVALSTSDGKLNVQYGTGLGKSTDNKLQVLLGTGLAVEGDYIRVEEAVYASIEEANAGVDRAHEVVTKLQTALGGKQDTLTLATGLEWGNTDIIQVKMNAPLTYDNCGRLMLNYDETLTVSGNKLGVDLYDVMDSGGGLFIKNTGLAVNAGRGLKIDSCQVVVDYGTGLKVVNNKLDVDTSKIAGAGIDLDSDYKMLTIGTKAAKELAGTGLVADGAKMKVKYGSGLTTNTCGGLIVDAANLTVGNANHASCADVAHGIAYTRYGGQVTHGGSSFAWYNVYHSTPYTQGDCVILNLRHSYYHAETASVTFAINVGYGNVNITQLGASPKCSTYNKIRVRWVNLQDVFIDVLILSHVANSDTHYVQGLGLGTFTPPIPTSDTTGIISEFSIRPGYFYAQNASADVFLGNLTGTADKAIADSQGNKITTTYAKQFSPTNGLTMNNDRVLSLPNLTASVANGAVDGVKNNNQRVLNLSCGAIQIKLSTGLAIDDNGYLYIQDKYVTK